eukprot:2369307-Amphidinium_carterae.1
MENLATIGHMPHGVLVSHLLRLQVQTSGFCSRNNYKFEKNQQSALRTTIARCTVLQTHPSQDETLLCLLYHTGCPMARGQPPYLSWAPWVLMRMLVTPPRLASTLPAKAQCWLQLQDPNCQPVRS